MNACMDWAFLVFSCCLYHATWGQSLDLGWAPGTPQVGSPKSPFHRAESTESTARNPSSFYVDCRLYRPTYEEVGKLWRVNFELRPPYTMFFFSVNVTKQAEYNRRSLGVGRRESLGHEGSGKTDTWRLVGAWQPFPGTRGSWLKQKNMSSKCARGLHPSHWLYDATLVKVQGPHSRHARA